MRLIPTGGSPDNRPGGKREHRGKDGYRMVGNGIIFSGLASGLDTQAIIEQLVALERLPIQKLEGQKAKENSKLELLGSLKGLVETLQEKADALRSAGNFFSYTVGVSTEGVATISATGSAQAGSHTLEVMTTAAIDRWAFDGVADDTVDLATADGQGITFTVDGVAYSATVTAASSNIHEIAAALNDAAGEAIVATVVNTGTESSPSHQLVIASKKSGEDFRVEGIGNTIAGLTIDGQAGSSNNITVGSNAVAVIDGLTVERSDNDFGDVIAGLSIDILSANQGQAMTFTVEPDREAIKGRVQELADAYNAVIDFVNEQNEYSEEGGPGGDLFGDPLLRRLRQEIQASLFDVDLGNVQNDTEGYSSLTLIGIQQDNDGRISINGSVFDQKMNENLELLSDLFIDTDGFVRLSDEPNTPDYFTDATADSGIADDLWRTIDRLVSTQEGPIIDQDTGERMKLDGIFGGREKVLRETIDRYNDQIEIRERRLEDFQENLVKRFAALEKLMGELNARGAALANALFNLPGPPGN